MLRIFAQGEDGKDPEPYAFTFTSPKTARAEAESIKDALSELIQRSKSSTGILAAPGGNNGNVGSAAMSIAPSVPSSGKDRDTWYDDTRLKSDVDLQQSLLRANPDLSKLFVESLRTKPDSITNSKFTSQFWSSRLHLLRAHAMEMNQSRALYNVLSTIKPRTDGDATMLSISKEQIQMIFTLHPLVKRAYDENVPRLGESAFWSGFFQSRLFKKLKGDKVSEDDPVNPILDKYLQYDEYEEGPRPLVQSHIPRIFDLEGNEANHSQMQGNRPDFTMRPSTFPLARRFNDLSAKILTNVTPSGIDPSLPIGVREDPYQSLVLRDLQAAPEENPVVLNVKDQSRFFSSKKEDDDSAEARRYAQLDPEKVLEDLKTDIDDLIASHDLESYLGLDKNDSSSDEEGENGPNTKRKVGRKASHAAATTQMLDHIQQQRAQMEDVSSSSVDTSNDAAFLANKMGLSDTMHDRVTLANSSTTELFSNFWEAFLSGDPDRADEIVRHVETLDRAKERLKTLAEEAEVERTAEIDRMKQQLRERSERTGRRIKFDPDSISGGRKIVTQRLSATVFAIDTTKGRYHEALAASAAATDATTPPNTGNAATTATTAAADTTPVSKGKPAKG